MENNLQGLCLGVLDGLAILDMLGEKKDLKVSKGIMC